MFNKFVLKYDLSFRNVRFMCAPQIIVYSQQNNHKTFGIFFQRFDLNCDAGSNGYCEESADHPDEGRQIGASVSLLLALSMLDG